ncbi:MAG TPA: DEAD/DEAH box helicase [bacterium]|nr:DEAD/DEAH box helicase [bacterium]
MNLTLRPYQIKAITDLRNAYRSGHRAPLLVAPTGSGKTVIFTFITEKATERGKSTLILVHRQELIDQTSMALSDMDVPHGIIAPKYPATHDKVQIASVQTLVRRMKRLTLQPQLIIIDECHHMPAKTYTTIINYYDSALRLGITATPLRLDGKGLSEYFDSMVRGPEVQELIDLGYLSEPIIYSFPFMKSLKSIHKRGGDFSMDELADVMNDIDITGDAIQHYLKYTPHDPAITFCTTIKHASDVTDAFNNCGVPSALFAGKMTRLRRRGYIEDLANGRIKNLVSCQMISEGTDIPIVRTSILLRPTQSLSMCLQQCGRVLRPYPGKPNSVILDHAGNCIKHGPPQWSREWSLDGVKRKPSVKISYKQCPRCFNMIAISAVQCPTCGYVYTAADREINYSDSELERLDPEELKLIKKREAGKRRSEVFEARTIDELIIIARQRGHEDGWAYHIMKAREAKGA